MVTTQGAGNGGKLCDSDSRSWAASVSSALRSRKMESLGFVDDASLLVAPPPLDRCNLMTLTAAAADDECFT